MIVNKFYTMIFIIIIGVPIFSNAEESKNITTGKCSPILSGDISGDFVLKCDDEDVMPFFYLDLSCTSYYEKNKNPDLGISNLYKFMVENSGRPVVIEYLESSPVFCESIEGLPEKKIIERFKVSGEYYSFTEHETFVYNSESTDDFYRFIITPKDPYNEKLSAKLANDCGFACSHWRLIGIPSTTYISGDGSTAVELEIAPRALMFTERYFETMDEVTRLSKLYDGKNHFSFSRVK